MPSPLDLLLHPVSLIFFAMYAVLMLWEAVAPARALPTVPRWRTRGLIAMAFYFLLSSYLPLLWTQYLLPLQLFDLSGLPLLAGAVVGLLVYQACAYAWHRALHGSALMWRFGHQMHHSAERLDTFSAFWFSPADTAGWTAVFSLALTVVIGLSAEATTGALLLASLLSMITHTNVRTPRWLGYFIERPEMHSWHHARGLHRQNYSELPVFDMLFGTYYNPRDFAGETGFHEGGSSRVIEMILGGDVAGTQIADGERPGR
jgi:sterol desaturase/sphingolipid hydroxylase (fatty acid hydroxylase superfamily)